MYNSVKPRKPTSLSQLCCRQYLLMRVPRVKKAVLDGVSWQKYRMFPTIFSLGLPTNAMPVRKAIDCCVPTFLSEIVLTMN